MAGPPPRPRRPGSHYGLLIVLMGCFVLGLAAATQYVAWAFGFHPNLGPPWLTGPPGAGEALMGTAAVLAGIGGLTAVLGGAVPRLRSAIRFVPFVVLVAALLAGAGFCEGADGIVRVYAPVRFLGWGLAYGGFEETSAYFDLFTRGLLVGGGALAFAAAAVLAARREAEPLVSTGSQGTAAWSDGSELTGADEGTSGGVLIGRQFSDAIGVRGTLRGALGKKPDPRALQRTF